MDKVLEKLARSFGGENISWGLGASFLLLEYGLVEKAQDIDIIVSSEDIERAILVLDSMAKRIEIPLKEEYSTGKFLVYELDGVSIDVMTSFRIKHSEGVYEFIFDELSIVGHVESNGETIPLTSLEDWLVAYDLMPGRESKVELIKKYLMQNGVRNPELLSRSLDQPLPGKTRRLVKKMLQCESKWSSK